jgi:hypothetical protein
MLLGFLFHCLVTMVKTLKPQATFKTMLSHHGFKIGPQNNLIAYNDHENLHI